MNTLANYLVEQILTELSQGVIVMLPGGFKPPHIGHIELAKRYASQPNVSEVRILIGPKERDGITMQQSMEIWKLLLGGVSNIKVEQAPNDNPMRAAYEYIETAEPGTYTLGSSSKGKDYDRVKMFVAGHAPETGKYHRPEVGVVELPINVSPILYKGRKDNLNGQGISASVLRADLAANNYENFKTNYPGVSDNTVKSIFDILSKKKVAENRSRSTLDELEVPNVLRNQFEKLKNKFGAFLDKLKQENRETKQAFAKLVDSVKSGKRLTVQERQQIGDQMKDVLKLTGYTAAAVLPGGVVYMLLANIPALKKHMIPSAFLAESKKLLKEGGAAGHMAHPYEDLDLTFVDARNMIDAALSGKVEFAQEKLDGQNLMVTYKDGKVRAARNKGQLKNYAENSITADQLDQMMVGKGAVQTAFVEAMRDMESAINKLDPTQKEQFFQNGKRFINFEVLFPGTTNVVPYGATQLRLHGFKEYDQDGNVADEDSKGAVQLQAAIDKVQASDQKTFQIRHTDPITLSKTKDYKKQKEELLKQLETIRKTYNLKEGDKTSMYFQAWWKNYIEQKAKELGYAIDDNTLQQLINRWGFGNKEVNIKNIRGMIKNAEFLRWVDYFDKNGVAAQQKEAKRPLENLFLKLGVYVLQNIQQLVSINPNDTVQKMRDELAYTIKGIHAAAASPEMQDDDKGLKFLKRELQRLQDLGGFKAIVPLEGVVFKYNKKIYKLTGAFAPINQIIGYLKFQR